MRKELLDELMIISEEEKKYKSGQSTVEQSLYAKDNLAEIDRKRLLQRGKLITVRPHSRFVDFPEHRHNYVEMMYVVQGSITHYIEGKELVLHKGDVLMLNQHVSHAIKRAEYEDIGINFIALPEFFEIPLTMLHAHQNEDIVNQYSMGLVFLYLMNHLENLSHNSSIDYKETIVQAVLEYINSDCKNANLSKIAEDTHQSMTVLSKLIKQKTGYKFQELLQRRRFQKAVYLLMETELTVEDIALEVGYENQSYFYRQFQKRYKMTPAKYRKLHKKDKRIPI